MAAAEPAVPRPSAAAMAATPPCRRDASRRRAAGIGLAQVQRRADRLDQDAGSAAVYATLIVTFGFQVARVEGQSMAPTLEDQDRLIVNKLAYRIGEPQRGDIVMLYYPLEPGQVVREARHCRRRRHGPHRGRPRLRERRAARRRLRAAASTAATTTGARR